MKSIKFFAVVLFLAAVPAFAQSPATADLDVTANVAQVCAVTTSPVAFGAYDPLSATADTANGNLAITCTRGATNIVVELGQGGAFSGGFRRMNDGGTEYLNYELFQDNGYATAWGEGAAAMTIAGPFAASTAQNFPVYGRIPAQQDAAVGNYSDVVLVEVNY